jgi:hypothetical protein
LLKYSKMFLATFITSPAPGMFLSSYANNAVRWRLWSTQYKWMTLYSSLAQLGTKGIHVASSISYYSYNIIIVKLLVLIRMYYHTLCNGVAMGHHRSLKLCPWRDIYDRLSYGLRSAPKWVVALRKHVHTQSVSVQSSISSSL